MKLYDDKAVEEYITKQDLWECTEIVQGSLVDNYFIFHDNNVIEVFEERYLNAWASALARHIYRKGLPKRIQALYDEYKAYESERYWKYETISYAEKHGIIEFYRKDNLMIYYTSFPIERKTYKAVVDLDTGTEKRTPLKRYYKAYDKKVGGIVQANYCV